MATRCDDSAMRGRETAGDSVDRWSRSDGGASSWTRRMRRRWAHFYADRLGWDLAKEPPDHCDMGSEQVTALTDRQPFADRVVHCRLPSCLCGEQLDEYLCRICHKQAADSAVIVASRG